MHAWTGKLLRADLTAGSVAVEEIPLTQLQDYLGGRGLAVRYLMDEIDPQVEPLTLGADEPTFLPHPSGAQRFDARLEARERCAQACLQIFMIRRLWRNRQAPENTFHALSPGPDIRTEFPDQGRRLMCCSCFQERLHSVAQPPQPVDNGLHLSRGRPTQRTWWQRPPPLRQLCRQSHDFVGVKPGLPSLHE